jgi:hypothetical protein
MKTILVLAASILFIFSAKADDDYATIVRYLGENGHYIISPDDVATVRALMKAHGYQHVSEIDKGRPSAAGDSLAQQTAAEPTPASEAKKTLATNYTSAEEDKALATGAMVLLLWIIVGLILYFLPTVAVIFNRHPHSGGVFLLNLLLGWTLIGWVCALVWAISKPIPHQVVVLQTPPTSERGRDIIAS